MKIAKVIKTTIAKPKRPRLLIKINFPLVSSITFHLFYLLDLFLKPKHQFHIYLNQKYSTNKKSKKNP